VESAIQTENPFFDGSIPPPGTTPNIQDAEEMEGRSTQTRGRRLFRKTHFYQQAINAKLALLILA
jgi:hypothetical protein